MGNNVFEPFEVDLTYKHEEQVYTNKTVDVDLSYPTGKDLKIDNNNSILKRAFKSLTEWGDVMDVSILHQPRLRENNGKSLIPEKGRMEVFIFGSNN